MARKRRKRRKPTLIYAPYVIVEPGGCYRAWIAIDEGAADEPCLTRMWRFSRDEADNTLYKIEHVERRGKTLCSKKILECLASDIRRVLARTQVLELEQRQTLRIRRSA